MPRMRSGLAPLVPLPPTTKPTMSVLSPVPAPVRTERLIRWPGVATTASTDTLTLALVAVGPELLVTFTVYEPESDVCALALV